MDEPQALIHVAVGVIVNGEQQILIALRPDNTHQGGLWEFPGGKVEPGETVQQALVRELQEELAVEASGFRPLLEVQHDYGDKAVLLDVWWVDRIIGQAHGQQGQALQWVDVAELGDFTFPAANSPIVSAVQRAFAVLSS